MSAVLSTPPTEETPPPAPAIGRTQRTAQPKKFDWGAVVPIFTLIFLFVFFALQEASFLTPTNLTNLSRQVSVSCILAFGMTIIILLGAIDLGIGSLLALGSVTAGLLQVNAGLNQEGPLGAAVSMAAVLGVCGTFGAFTGFMVSRLKMPPFVVTLGILVMARGLALILSGSSRIAPLSDSYAWIATSFLPPTFSAVLIIGIAALAMAYFIFQSRKYLPVKLLVTATIAAGLCWVFWEKGIPGPVVVMSIVFGLVYFLLNWTTYGRYVYAIGGNPEAARLCGIRVPLVLFLSFVLMGLFVGLSAIIESGRLAAGDPNAGNLYELDAIAAVVIGGTSLQGGIGSVQGTLIGAILIGTLNNGLSLMDVPTNYQMIIKGLIIIFAVLMDVSSKKGNR